MAKNNITIHKDNDIIQKPITTKLSVTSMKILDYLYHYSQKKLNNLVKKNIRNKSKVIKHFENNPYRLLIPQTKMREWAGLEEYSNYTKMIRNSIKELKKDLEFKNYIDEKGKPIRWALKSFIKNVTESVSEQDNKTIVYDIEIDSSLISLILSLENNFTQIDLKYQKNWKSNNTLRLYQYFKSIQNMENNPEHNLKWLNTFLAPKTEFKFLSKGFEILNRNIKIINNDTDVIIDLVVNKASKTFTFDIKSKNVVIKDIGKIAKQL